MTKTGGPINVAELLAKANQPSADAMTLHPYYRGKMEVALKVPVRDFNDFAIWYTPGVGAPCKAIAKNPELVYEYTHKWNTVAIVSDGTRVLGLGDIGPKAGLPVMEGKALIFKYLGGVDAWPIVLDTKDPDKLIETVLLLQPGFGGINLEDIAQPKCFQMLDTLRDKAEIPVWHDDQQGTATVALAGLTNALKVVGKDLEKVRIAFIGVGAANVACARLLFAAGVDPSRCVMADIDGILSKKRSDIESHKEELADHWRFCQITNPEGRQGGIPEAMAGADVVIAYSKPGPGTIKPSWVQTMAKDPVIFACANPVPEIWPWEAKEAGAAVIATGRSDFPNQANNSLCFPGLFRGALDVRARTISDGMCMSAAEALASMACDKGLSSEYILPTMEEWEVAPREAAAVAVKAVEEGLALKALTYEEELKNATEIIRRSRQLTQTMTDAGLILKAPE